ncbi:semaphorin-1A [Drosophila nasuta]|uniref:Semaphorin-1A n=1 Tax=Drosophila albomicans TaxID=7291 RepID=A0A6P8WZ08_DROAB|nr:semaphorin-1A [Drosophila albomicans]XP_034103869.1 semaphorin-1A [Drosophila albomicans]XP_051859906.1 semaphorin-1A [Drosophila albomicans]XP_060653431.1 semaphorin-1A [Drosophila nasuta]XP_060653434.1 semaphorin-1A [Drosophila nasuta]
MLITDRRRIRQLTMFNAFITLCLCLLVVTIEAWMPDVRPDLQTKPDKVIASFFGNTTDYYKILDHDDESVLVGAKDVIYNISMMGLKENSRLVWNSSGADRELCMLKGKHEWDCHNYMRVYAPLSDGQILLCGTNSYKPRCRHYTPVEQTPDGAGAGSMRYEITRDVEAQGLCPYSPAHNSTYAFADGHLYSATVADFSGGDPLIYRENLRTEQYDLKQLNQPDFVGAFERNGYVFFFFRELSMEYMNFGKAVYSRVGRVCKNDRGGPYNHGKSWTSFLKARLNCSMPGDFPFYFDEIQAISPVVEINGQAMVYAVFTTSVNAIPGSAVCAYRVDDILAAFDGDFKSQKDSQSHWLPVEQTQVPKPRPGQCVDDSRTLASISVNFIKNHPLMESAVPAVHNRPLLTKVTLMHRLTAIAVDAQVQALNGKHYDVIYSGTDDGKVTKFINVITSHPNNTDRLRTVVISEMQVLPLGTPVREMVISSKKNTLVVVSDGRLVTVPLHHCSLIMDCVGCLSMQDPNCAWDLQTHECKNLAASQHKFGTKTYLQSLNTTKKSAASLCPKTAADPVIVTMPPSQVDDSQKLHYASVAEKPSSIDQQATGVGVDFALNDYIDENKIPQASVDPEQVMTSLHDPQKSIAVVNELQKATLSSYNVLIIVFVIMIAFFLGTVAGIKINKKCKQSRLDASHHNHFGKPTQFKHQNSGKDINLLINSNPYTTTQKTPNLDLEKDRSHECKNSTEHLEKELPCKTSTLTKVKRTYI